MIVEWNEHASWCLPLAALLAALAVVCLVVDFRAAKRAADDEATS